MFRVLTVNGTSKERISEGVVDVGLPNSDEIRWIDLSEQEHESVSLLAERFGFHPLTVEDCLHFDQRPKLELYEGYAFLVVHGFHVDWDDVDRSDALELHIFIGQRFVITVHERQIPSLEEVWRRASIDGRQVSQGADHLAYLIVDELIDSYFPLLDELQLRLDQLEDRVLDQAHEVELWEIMDFKRLLLELRRILSTQRDVLALLAKRGDGYFSDRVSIYFRDVYDHALRLHESVESARELVANVRDAHLWHASQRTNEIMKRLTILSAIFLPLTFITGFFGQNFESLPFHSTWLMYVMMASCIGVPIGMLLYFVRSRWF